MLHIFSALEELNYQFFSPSNSDLNFCSKSLSWPFLNSWLTCVRSYSSKRLSSSIFFVIIDVIAYLIGIAMFSFEFIMEITGRSLPVLQFMWICWHWHSSSEHWKIFFWVHFSLIHIWTTVLSSLHLTRFWSPDTLTEELLSDCSVDSCAFMCDFETKLILSISSWSKWIS